MSLTDAILSPKVLMLLYINNELLGGNGESLKPSDLIKLMKGVIKSMINEIKDMIMQKIMDYILEQLMPLALKLLIFYQNIRKTELLKSKKML